MRYRVGLLLLVLVTLVLVGCGRFGVLNLQRGSGNLKTESRQVSGFHGVTLAYVGELNITQGDTESLSIEADDNILPLIETDVQDGILRIRTEPVSGSIIPTKGPIYTLSVKSLDSVQRDGAGNIRIPSLNTDSLHLVISGAGDSTITQLTTKDLQVLMSGAGTVTVSGETGSQTATLSGLGSYNAGDLKSTQAAITISGAGSATVWAEQTLNVQISGAGTLSYYGNPQVTQQVAGVGSIKQLGSK